MINNESEPILGDYSKEKMESSESYKESKEATFIEHLALDVNKLANTDPRRALRMLKEAFANWK